MRRLWKYSALFVAVSLIAVTVLAAVTIRRPFPDAGGEVVVPGLKSEVEVIRDDNGIAHIYGDTADDLFYAQGFVHAQDRFFEMDVRRHITAGRLSELFGEASIETDEYVRTLGWRRVAEEEVENLDPKTREYLQAYADGVNAYISDASASSLALEYSVLSLTGDSYTPEPWTPADSVAWIKAMSWDLRSNMADEIDRSLAATSLSEERVEELFPSFPADERAPIVSDANLGGGGGAIGEAPDALARPAPGVRDALESMSTVAEIDAKIPTMLGTGDGIGSNSWVVSGDLTDTGEPILANDPHLAPSMPNIWHQSSLKCREKTPECPFDVTGFQFAGIPGIIVGHNDRVAWGVTTMYADVTDLYIERIEGDEYEYDGEMIPLETRNETIEVAGGDDVEITIRETRNGPLLSDIDERIAGAGHGRVDAEDLDEGDANDAETSDEAADDETVTDYGVSLRWTALEPQQTIDAVFSLAQVTDWDSFRAAAEQFTVPSQNLVYADVDGNIGYQAPGLIPVRNEGDGTWPAPGWDPDYQWDGTIPFDDLPSVLNPEEGYIVTANQPVTSDEYDQLIGHPGAYGYRSDRIIELLGEADTLDVETMVEIQMDAENGLARDIVPQLDYDLGSAYYNEALDLLHDWDFQQGVDSSAAAYFNAFYADLLERTFGDEIPSDVSVTGGERWMETTRVLFDDPRNAWWDDASTPQIIEARDEIVMASLREARDELTRRQSRHPDNWSWGDLHQLELEHQTLGTSGIAVVEALFNRGPYPVAGGSGAVNANSWDASEGFEVTAVPSMRMVVDLADFDRSRWIQMTGNSGHPFHRNYRDQFDLWREGETLGWDYSRSAIEESERDTLVLVPDES